MKLLMTADAVGGVWQYSIDLVGALAQHGVDVLVATFGPRPSGPQREQMLATGAQIAESDFALEWMPGAEAGFDQSSAWLLEVRDRFQPELVHVNGYGHAALAWGEAPVVCVAHSCVCSWWRAVHGCEPGADYAWYRAAVKLGLERASAIVAPSAAMAACLVQEYGIRSADVVVVSNGSAVAAETSREKLPFCFSAARFSDESKNVALLQAIAPSVLWPIQVAGSPKADIPAPLDALGHLSRASLLRKLQAASLFLHPALYEPFGLSVLEAARSRCCLVLSDIPSLRELWQGCAQFADPHDPQEWIFEVNRLTRDAAERAKLAEKAHKRSLQYSIQAMAQAYLEVYNRLRQSGRLADPQGAAA